jgi:hypothetical protein
LGLSVIGLGRDILGFRVAIAQCRPGQADVGFGAGTAPSALVEAPKGWLPKPLAAIVNWLSYRRMRERIEAYALVGPA